MNKGWLGTVIIILLIWFFFFRQSDTWKGFYYPDSGNLLNDVKSPMFESLDQCREWVDEMVDKYNPNGEGYDYECGKNCKYKSEYGLEVCAETVR